MDKAINNCMNIVRTLQNTSRKVDLCSIEERVILVDNTDVLAEFNSFSEMYNYLVKGTYELRNCLKNKTEDYIKFLVKEINTLWSCVDLEFMLIGKEEYNYALFNYGAISYNLTANQMESCLLGILGGLMLADAYKKNKINIDYTLIEEVNEEQVEDYSEYIKFALDNLNKAGINKVELKKGRNGSEGVVLSDDKDNSTTYPGTYYSDFCHVEICDERIDIQYSGDGAFYSSSVGDIAYYLKGVINGLYCMGT